jgi:predicted flavoprotein YhiN
VKVTCQKTSFKENMLFTHKGLSGPAILQISSYWKEGEPIIIDLLEYIDLEKVFQKYRQDKIEFGRLLSKYLPRN